MKFTEEHYRTVAETLKRVVVSEDIKLEWGARQRQLLREQIASGSKAPNYRAVWLRSTRDAVIDTIKKRSEVFNNTYKHDKISAQDMMDALTTTLNHFKLAMDKLKGSKPHD